jgi:hypothetical protein
VKKQIPILFSTRTQWNPGKETLGSCLGMHFINLMIITRSSLREKINITVAFKHEQ